MSSDAPAPPRFIPLTYNNADSQASALRLCFTLFPAWEQDPGEVKLTRFTDGITNTLLKAAKRRPGWTEEQIDAEAILIRAYGEGTEILIDREREAASQLLLATKGLAPPLLARFQNGILYRFVQGHVCSPADLRRPAVYRGVAKRLGEWHAQLPVSVPIVPVEKKHNEPNGLPIRATPVKRIPSDAEANAITPNKVTPNVWTVMQRWVLALPATTDAERARNERLQKELERTVKEFADLPGIGDGGLVLGHCDLLSGNVIVLPHTIHQAGGMQNGAEEDVEGVAFIDYEYTTPAPAAFDLANHFAEFGGFECTYEVLPTQSTRREFLADYLASYFSNYQGAGLHRDQPEFDAELDNLCATVDRFRGVPGLYWGIWALIQTTISQIDFDYASYAEVRLGEYWAWREEEDVSRKREGREMSLRERRWAEE